MSKAPKYAERAVSFEARDSSDDGFTLEGYGAVFNQPTRIDSHEGRFDEVIDRSAFSKTLMERTPVLQFDHGRDPATGSVPIGSIQDIRADDHGLFVSARMHDNARVERSMVCRFVSRCCVTIGMSRVAMCRCGR